MKTAPKGGKNKGKDKGKDTDKGKDKVKDTGKGRQPAPVVEEEPDEQDLMQQGETGAEGDNRGDPDQSEAHSDVDEDPIPAGSSKKK